MGFGFGMNSSSGKNSSQSTNSTNVWGGQAPFLQDMFGQGSSLMQQQQGVGQYAQDMMGGMLPGINAAMGSMGNMAQGGGPLQQFTNPNNGLISQQLGMLGSSLGDMFNNTVMPGLTSQANSAGGLGGSRHQLGIGQAAGNMFDQFQQGATSIMGNAYNQAANSAGQLQQSMMGAAGAMPGMGGDIFNLGMSPFNAAWAPLQNQAGLLGGPTVLGQGQSSAQGKNQSSGWKIGMG